MIISLIIFISLIKYQIKNGYKTKTKKLKNHENKF